MFDKSENQRKYYRGRDCMKMFCNDLKEQAMRIINYEQKPMIPLTNEEKDHMRISKFVIYVKENFVLIKIIKKNFKKCKKLEIIVITQENTEELLIVFAIYVIK